MNVFEAGFTIVNDSHNTIGNEVRKHAENRRIMQQGKSKALPVHLFGAFNRG